jgi:hypothetical protein
MLRQLDHLGCANRAPCCALSKPAPTKCSSRVSLLCGRALVCFRAVCCCTIICLRMSSKHVFLFHSASLGFLESIQTEEHCASEQSLPTGRSRALRVLLWVFECGRKSRQITPRGRHYLIFSARQNKQSVLLLSRVHGTRTSFLALCCAPKTMEAARLVHVGDSQVVAHCLQRVHCGALD